MTWNQAQNIGWARPVQSTTNDIVFVLTHSNCEKQKIFTHKHKHSEQVSIHLVSDKLPSMKQSLWYSSFCSQIEKACKSNVIKKVKYLVKWSSIFWLHDWLTDMLCVITDPNTRSAKPRLCQTFTENAGISNPKHSCRILKCAKFETRFLAPASRIEAPATVGLGVHRGAFREQQLRSRDVAVARRTVQRRFASGAFSPETRRPLWASGGPRRGDRCAEGTTEVVGSSALCPFNRQTNDECFGLNSFKLCKQNIFTHKHKHSEQVSIHLVSDKLPSMKQSL